MKISKFQINQEKKRDANRSSFCSVRIHVFSCIQFLHFSTPLAYKCALNSNLYHHLCTLHRSIFHISLEIITSSLMNKLYQSLSLTLSLSSYLGSCLHFGAPIHLFILHMHTLQFLSKLLNHVQFK